LKIEEDGRRRKGREGRKEGKEEEIPTKEEEKLCRFSLSFLKLDLVLESIRELYGSIRGTTF